MLLLKIIRYVTLFLILLNFPAWVLVKVSPVLSNLLSVLSFALMMIYFFLAKNWSLNKWMIVLGFLYFITGALVDQTYIADDRAYIVTVIKYFIVVLGGYALIRDTTKQELFFFLIAGAVSVFLQIFFFYNPFTDGGRYSGFYLNPNSLGFICIMGFGLSYGFYGKWRVVGQVIFTIIGFLTFSRTFIVLWLLTNIISARLSIKNLRVLGIGVGLFIAVLTYNAFLPKSNARLDSMARILQGKSSNTSKLEEGSRTETWSYYYTALLEQPILGHGYAAFNGGAKVSHIGPHNAYIKIWGEGGILTLLAVLIFYFSLLRHAWSSFLQFPHLLFMVLVLCLYMTTNHNYWDSWYLLFLSMWLQHRILGQNVSLNEQTSSPVNENTKATT